MTEDEYYQGRLESDEDAAVDSHFAADSLHWRGRVLTGRHAHWCVEWDDLPIDETCPEWPCGCGAE